jgi:hypothetical protein
VNLTLSAACLLAVVSLPSAERWRPATLPLASETTRVALTEAVWTNDGMPAPPPPITGQGALAQVSLPVHERGERWAIVFQTGRAGTAGLVLDHRGGPDGLLYEVVLDGQRLTPARDAWRPSARDLRTDLGPLWLGQGDHLLELVVREEPSGAAALHLRALELAWK